MKCLKDFLQGKNAQRIFYLPSGRTKDIKVTDKWRLRVLRTSAPWKDLPERHGERKTIYSRFQRGARRHLGQNIC
jgi:transposase